MLPASQRAAAGLCAALLAWFLVEHDGHACGGCFHPPAETPTVVTDHRMILAVTPQESTLWDQIEYSGDPSSFAWVLPISGTVRVGLSADSVFQKLDQLTRTQIVPPPLDCPQPPPPSGCSSVTTAQSSYSGARFDPGVEVTKREVVGPYETVQLKATDPNALEAWLAQNGFVVPADVRPVVDAYVGEKFDFLALRLLPGKGVKDMRPVRVTTPGANAVLPLRMVAAGTGPVVGITLWVVAEGRYEPQNFPWFRIRDDELVWDWTQNRSNYIELRAAKTQDANGRAWDVESSTTPSALFAQSLFPAGPGAGASGDYLFDDAARKSADQVRDEDIAALFAGRSFEATRITRLRADLSHAALATDLVMIASQDQSVLASTRQVVNETSEPPCPVYDQGARAVGTAPRSKAQEYADHHERFACATTRARSRSAFWVGAVAAVVAIAIARGFARRRIGA